MKNYCGIDIGCTNIKMVAMINNIPHHKIISSGDSFTREELIDCIYEFYSSFDANFSGLGIAFSGYTFDSITVGKTSLQCLENLSTIDFEKLHCNNIHLINDSNATALAGLTEYPTAKVLVGITNGTGIGCGVVINGHLFTGSNHILGEIYGNTVIENNNITKIGRICSGSKILKKLSEKPNDPVFAKEILQEASINLGNLLISIIHLYNPDVLYFSGGGFSLENLLEDSITYAKQLVYPDFLVNLTFVNSSYHDFAGCFGAIKYVQMNE